MATWSDFWAEAASVFPIVLSLEAGRYVVTAGAISLLIAVFWGGWFKARKLQTRSAAVRDYRREILTSLRTSLVFATIGFGMYLASKAGWLTIFETFEERGPVYFVITLVAMIVAHDAYFYWTHRALHHPRLFRTFHATHHRSRTPTPWAAYAFDVPEAVVMLAFVPIWAAIVPMHDLALFAFMSWQIVRNVMGHAGVEFSPASGKRSRMFGWLNTTTHHDLHHQDSRVNFGLYFSWWDRLMGTEHPEYQARVAEIVGRSKVCRNPTARSVKIAALAFIVVTGAIAMPEKAWAQAERGINGRWATHGFGSIVEIAPCTGDDEATLCGRIVWLWEPTDSEGRPRTDHENPDASLRTRSLVGVDIIRDLRQTAPGEWGDGAVYNPDDGRTYSGRIRLLDGALALRGCALKFICQTQTWRRPEDVFAAVRELDQ
ncbi:MAG: DUF2147 domain-containing protein [Sphingomonadales bacterium]|nr:DUF2147 domain-containing protein [Sphingomonadales bacterium]